jgi:hypothetical protein
MMPATMEIGNITACSHPRNIGFAISTGATWLSMLREATGRTGWLADVQSTSTIGDRRFVW